MTGIHLIHVESKRLFGAQRVHAKFKSSHLRLHRLGWELYWSPQMTWIKKRPTTSITTQVTP